MSGKQLWLLVGGNGAGKTTFYELFLKPRGLAFVNADRMARTLEQHQAHHAERAPARQMERTRAPEPREDLSYDAAVLTERMREDLLDRGLSFCYETVFSHPSKIDFTARAKAMGYQVILVLVHLDDPSLSLARISERTSEGGHGVPEEKVRARLPRMLANVSVAMTLADEVHLLDNSSCEEPFRQVAVVRDGEAQPLADPAPDWVLRLLGQTPG